MFRSLAHGISEYAILYSTKEYKKVRLEFYQPEFYAWARENLGTQA